MQQQPKQEVKEKQLTQKRKYFTDKFSKGTSKKQFE